MKKHFKKILTGILLLSMVCILPMLALAAGQGSIHAVFQHNNTAIPGADFDLYQVAVSQPGAGYELTQGFAGYNIDLSNLTEEALPALAEQLAIYVAQGEIAADATKTTDENGAVDFTELPDGLYLLTGKSITIDNVLYIPQPSLVFLPAADGEGQPTYDVTILPKYERRELTGEKLQRRALKIWKDEGHENERPHEITVQLLRDNQVYDEQVLNAANGWGYTWSDLDEGYEWKVQEKDVPADYDVTIELNGITFTVTNTYNVVEPTPTPTPPVETTPPPDEPDLPETGLLWWPVPVLAAFGVLFLLVGVYTYRSKKQHE